jgi:hypothetical protein
LAILAALGLARPAASEATVVFLGPNALLKKQTRTTEKKLVK